MKPTAARKIRLSVVSYLNTVPLVWGLRYGPQQGLYELRFAVPAECSAQVERGETDAGILPVVEAARQGLCYLPSTGIASRGEVRSILLISKVDPCRIQTLAADSGSRNSVMLARVILRRRYGSDPVVVSHEPRLAAMLRQADAALLIGDAALALNPAEVPYLVMDLGAEWKQMTGLPMVAAVWAGKPEAVTPELDAHLLASCRYGLSRIEEIVGAESARLGFAPQLIREYFARNVTLLLGEEEHRGLDLFLQYAAELEERLSPVRLARC